MSCGGAGDNQMFTVVHVSGGGVAHHLICVTVSQCHSVTDIFYNLINCQQIQLVILLFIPTFLHYWDVMNYNDTEFYKFTKILFINNN